MKASLKKVTYFGILILLMVFPFLFSNVNQSSNNINNQTLSKNDYILEDESSSVTNFRIDPDYVTTDNSVKIKFDFDEKENYANYIAYKVNLKGDWIELNSIDPFDNELLIENVDPVVDNKIEFLIKSREEDNVWFSENSFDFKVDPRNPIVSNLQAKDITKNSTNIEFNVELGNTNNTLKTKLTFNGEGTWEEYDAVEGKNTIKLTSLRPDTDYKFYVKVDFFSTDEIEFTTRSNGFIENLEVRYIQLNGADIHFDYTYGSGDNNVFYRLIKNEIPGEWVDYIPRQSENRIQLRDLDVDTNYKFEIEIEDVQTHSTEFTTLRNSYINNLNAVVVDGESANIYFDVLLGDVESDFSYKLTDEENSSNWIDFIPVEGENIMELNDLTKATDYIFEIKIEDIHTYQTEFITSINSVISNLDIQDVGTNSAMISLDVALDDSMLNEKFYYKTSLNIDQNDNEWIEFTPVEGKNIIELTNLAEGIDYIFEVKIDETDIIKEIEFMTLRSSMFRSLELEEIEKTSVQFIFSFQAGDSILNEKFYYRVIEKNQSDGDWIEFTPVEGKNIVKITDLEDATDYKFELKISEYIDTSLGFKTPKDIINLITIWFIILTSIAIYLTGITKFVFKRKTL